MSNATVSRIYASRRRPFLYVPQLVVAMLQLFPNSVV